MNIHILASVIFENTLSLTFSHIMKLLRLFKSLTVSLLILYLPGQWCQLYGFPMFALTVKKGSVQKNDIY